MIRSLEKVGKAIGYIDRRTDRQTERQAEKQSNRQTDRQSDKQTDRETDRQTDRQTDRYRRSTRDSRKRSNSHAGDTWKGKKAYKEVRKFKLMGKKDAKQPPAATRRFTLTHEPISALTF